MFVIEDGLSGGASISIFSNCDAVFTQNQLVVTMNSRQICDGILQNNNNTNNNNNNTNNTNNNNDNSNQNH